MTHRHALKNSAAAVAVVLTAALISKVAGWGLGHAAAAPAAEGTLVTTLVGRDARIGVHATSQGTRYSIVAADGRTIAANLTADEVAQRFPGQDPRNVTTLMLADPDHRIGE